MFTTLQYTWHAGTMMWLHMEGCPSVLMVTLNDVLPTADQIKKLIKVSVTQADVLSKLADCMQTPYQPPYEQGIKVEMLANLETRMHRRTQLNGYNRCIYE